MTNKIIFSIVLFASTAVASDKVNGHPTPLKEELLPQAIHLTRACENIYITEWKDYSFSDKDIKIVDDVCNNVVNNFYSFVNSKGLKYNKKIKPFYKVSLLPWDESFDGRGYRNLNDFKYRFADRPSFCDTNGRECNENEVPFAFRGWTDLENQYHFLRNDPQINSKPNKKFNAILAHELFHELSWESGVYSSHNSVETEEQMAKSFTQVLGYGDI